MAARCHAAWHLSRRAATTAIRWVTRRSRRCAKSGMATPIRNFAGRCSVMHHRAHPPVAGCGGASKGLGTTLRVAAVIPTLNEAEAIAATIASIPRDIVDEVIVADSSSNDGTADVARAAGARIVSLVERGYGRACA